MFLSNIYLSFDFISKLILVSLYVRVYTVVELLPYFKIRFKVWLFIRYMQIEMATLFERASFVLRYWIHSERIEWGVSALVCQSQSYPCMSAPIFTLESSISFHKRTRYLSNAFQVGIVLTLTFNFHVRIKFGLLWFELSLPFLNAL